MQENAEKLLTLYSKRAIMDSVQGKALEKTEKDNT